MARGKSAYNQFVARRLKGTPSKQLPSAMRAAAAEWNAMQHGGRSNPGGSLGTLLILGGVGYFGYKYLKSHGGLGAPAAPVVAR